MRQFRLLLYFVLGFMLVAVPMLASAQVVYTSKDGVISRASDGRVASVSAPSSSSLLSDLLNRDALTINRESNYQVTEKNGNKVSIPVREKISLSAPSLSKAAGTVAFFARGGVQSAILGALIEGGIHLLQDEWKKTTTTPINPDTWYSVGSIVTQDRSSLPDPACKVWTGNSTATGSWEGDQIRCMSLWKGEIQNHGLFRPGTFLRCPDGRSVPLEPPQNFCGTITDTKPASEKDLQDQLAARTASIDGALKDYYDSLPQSKKDEVVANAPYSQTSTATNGSPQTVTKTDSAGNTQTTTTINTYNTTYNQGDTVSNSVVNVTNSYTTTITNKAADGTITGQETIKSTPDTVPPPEKQDYSFADSGLPDIPDLYEQKYKDGIVGVWNTKIAELKGTSIFSLVGMFSSGAPNGGSCPSWNFDLSGLHGGVHQLQPPCIVWSFAKWALIITALFVARRLVFGG